MAITGQGINSGMQGAQLGGKLGGGWGAAIGGVLGLFSGNAAAKRAEKARDKYNDQVVKLAAQDLFDMRRVQNVQNIRTAQALSTYQTNKKTQTSTIVASLGAADIIGSSAQALQQTLEYQTNEAMADTMNNWEAGVENYNIQINQQTAQRDSTLQKAAAEGTEIDAGALLSAGVDLYSTVKGGGLLTGDDLNIAKNKVKHAGYSLMGQLSSVWSENTGSSGTLASLNSDVGKPYRGVSTSSAGKDTYVR